MNLTHFERHVLYHDRLDRYEARVRAYNEAQRMEIAALEEWAPLIADPDQDESVPAFVQCSCGEIAGDNDDCPIHGLAAQECTCGPNPDAPACPSCRARHANDELPF